VLDRAQQAAIDLKVADAVAGASPQGPDRGNLLLEVLRIAQDAPGVGPNAGDITKRADVYLTWIEAKK